MKKRAKTPPLLHPYELHLKILEKLISGKWKYVTELARETGIGIPTVSRNIVKLAKFGLIETIEKPGPQGGIAKHCKITNRGLIFSHIFSTIREEKRAKEIASPDDVRACLNVLKSAKGFRLEMGAKGLRDLCRYKRVRPPLVVEITRFMSKSLSDPRYETIRQDLLWAWKDIIGRSKARGEEDVLSWVNGDALKRYCLNPEDKFCAAIALQILSMKNEHLAINTLLEMTKKLPDEKWDHKIIGILPYIRKDELIGALSDLKDKAQRGYVVTRATLLLEEMGVWFELPPELRSDKKA